MAEPKAARQMGEVEVLARTLWAEARNGRIPGMEAVAWVILNRARNPRWWGNSIRSVCLRRAQFSCWLPSDPQHRRMIETPRTDPDMARAWDVAERAVQGMLRGDPTKGADHYFAPAGMAGGKPPRWADPAKLTLEAHGHRFYRLELPAPVEPEPHKPRTYAAVGATAAVGVAAQAAEALGGLDWRVATALIVAAAVGAIAWRWIDARREARA